MLRYIRAFFIALKMTLRGEKIQPSPYAPLIAWMERGAVLLTAVYAAADKNGLDKAARQKLTLKLEGRDLSLQTALAGVDHHLRQEYPYLLKNLTEHSITGIYASNLNDQFRIMRLRDADFVATQPSLREAVTQLSDHLNAIPPSNG